MKKDTENISIELIKVTMWLDVISLTPTPTPLTPVLTGGTWLISVVDVTACDIDYDSIYFIEVSEALNWINTIEVEPSLW